MKERDRGREGEGRENSKPLIVKGSRVRSIGPI